LTFLPFSTYPLSATHSTLCPDKSHIPTGRNGVRTTPTTPRSSFSSGVSGIASPVSEDQDRWYHYSRDTYTYPTGGHIIMKKYRRTANQADNREYTYQASTRHKYFGYYQCRTGKIKKNSKNQPPYH
jgi:hypothetical protein